jgi:hydrogenase maturation factor
MDNDSDKFSRGSDTMMEEARLRAPLPPGKLPSWLLAQVLPKAAADPSVLVGPGIGRDAAAIAIGDRAVVVKSDPITFASSGGEQHLVDVNANDIACLGAAPRWLLVTALLPFGVTPDDIARDFASLQSACQRRGIDLVGGHTEILTDLARPILVGTMLGDADPARLLRPGQAQAGDTLLLTKALAIEGTALLAREMAPVLEPLVGADTVRTAAALLRDPGISVVRDAEIALRTGGVTALHDPTEGGLATAVRELATASATGAKLDPAAIPILPETKAIAAALGLDPLGMLASGSLLIAARPDAAHDLTATLRAADIPTAVIGRLTSKPEWKSMLMPGGVRDLPEFPADEVARALALTGTSTPES